MKFIYRRVRMKELDLHYQHREICDILRKESKSQKGACIMTLLCQC